MHVVGRGVAGLTGVDDDHRPSLATELERGGKSGGRTADDGDVAVPLDGVGGVVTHGFDDKIQPGIRMNTCEIRKEMDGAHG